jgi:hypothetical protein
MCKLRVFFSIAISMLIISALVAKSSRDQQSLLTVAMSNSTNSVAIPIEAEIKTLEAQLISVSAAESTAPEE